MARKHRYTELATSLNVRDPQTGQWQPANEAIDILPDGTAAATRCENQIFFPGDIAQGVIRLVLASGQQMQSRPIALVLDDGSQTALIALLTNSAGVLTASNEVTYPNAFEGVAASLRFKNTKAGLEQDVIIQGQLPSSPGALGLNEAKTKIGVLTEFFDTADPVQTLGLFNPQDGLSDPTFTFGTIQMTHGRAFFIGGGGSGSTQNGQSRWIPADIGGTPTYKSWLKLNGQTFLLEQIPYPQVAPQLEQLPPATGRLDAGSTNLFAANSFLNGVPAGLLSPPARGAAVQPRKIQLAKTDVAPQPALVLDYVTLNSGQTNWIFQGDSTYFISGECNLRGATTIEGGAVIKANNNGRIDIDQNGTIVCNTGPYRPAVFTSFNDNTVGEAISGSSGSPALYDVNLFLNINATNAGIHDLRLAYCNVAVSQGGAPALLAVWNCQFRNNATALNGYNLELFNVLIASAATFYPTVNFAGPSLVAENVTAGYASGGSYGNCFVYPENSSATVALTNCLITGEPIFFAGSATLLTNATVCLTSPSTPIYQTAGAGSFYLTNGSPYRTNGTVNIDPWLLTDIAAKTTYPPIVYSNLTISVVTNFSSQVPRDNSGNAVALGYHYDPLDYCFGGMKATASLTFAAGTAVGWFELPGSSGNGYGLSLTNGTVANFGGTATNPCWFVRYSCVQEGGNGLWKDKSYPGGIVNQTVYDPGNPSALQLAFTRLSLLANDSCMFRDGSSGQPIVIQAGNCEFYGSSGGYNILAGYTNCLFYRADFGMGTAAAYPFQRYVNCTFYGGSLYFGHWEGHAPYWCSYIHNCAFDGTAFSLDDPFGSNTNYADYNYNAFNPGAPQPTNEGASTIIVTNGFNWQASWLGYFYQATNSALRDAGDRTADRVGFAEFTTQTNQTKEGISPVDIGYHYVATDAYGNPVSTLVSGVPDYISDGDGDGLLDSWEVNWLGNLNHTGSELDSGGVCTLHYDFQYGIDPIYSSMVVAWGNDNAGQCDVPYGLTNAVQVAGGYQDSFVLKSDHTIAAWGTAHFGETTIPTNLPNVAVVACGELHVAALLTNGTVGVWGYSNPFLLDYMMTNVPPGLANVVTISAQGYHTLALTSNGMVVAWGNDYYGQTNVPAGLSCVSSVAAGAFHSLAVSNGSVVPWGWNNHGQTSVPSGLSNVWKIAAGLYHSVALKTNGTVVCWGNNTHGETNVPVGLSNVVAIAAGGYPYNPESAYTLALKNDGTVVAWGDGPVVTSLGGLTNVIAIGGGDDFGLAIRSGPPMPVVTLEPVDQYQIAGGSVIFNSKGVGLYGVTYQWQLNGVNIGGATNATLTLTNVQAAQAGVYNVVLTGNGGLGSITSSNANLNLVTPPVITWQSQPTNIVCIYGNYVSFAAAVSASYQTNGFPLGYQWQFNGTNISSQNPTNYNFFANDNSSGVYSLVASNLAGSASASWRVTVTNAINITNDLLLIYNTNSTDSTTVLNYYLTHRPMVGGANVLGIGCTNGEIIARADFTNQILVPYLNWLTNNPTKHPQYIVLFLDIPSRVEDSPTNYFPSVQFQLAFGAPPFQPFVTSINMNGTNDCIAYINKLVSFGTNGRLVISASANGYGNTNYVLDDIRNGGPPPDYEDYSTYGGKVSSATNGLLVAGVDPNAIFFYDGLAISNMLSTALPHATGLTNVAGYMSWGVHGCLTNTYPIDGSVVWKGNSGWWIIETAESFNGQRSPSQGNFVEWFSSNGFGGWNYSNTPVGAVCHVEEPRLDYIENSPIYFGLWASGKIFAICAWNSRQTPFFQVVGDPFVTR